ncbi:glycosyltransferase [Crenobacter caeni]|uniref:Glycosyltransferase n=1 Tax=Crenobacter caeni TaxID=2705474 RepID=A0A6B2KSS7_9NEIS|nr:glycosyltransferase [Crenobacter caeni]NDV13292.1 glycosyltransferase [Crenobacter caeni]
MNKTINIGVIIASFNGEKHIIQQITSITKQSLPDDHVINIFIGDDMSTDKTIEKIFEFKKSNPKITFLQNIKSSGSAGQNFFRLLASVNLENFDYISLSDQDDIWSADKIFTAISKIEEHNVDCYSSNVTAFWPSGRQELINKAQPQTKWDYMFEAAGPGCTYVITKKFALELQNTLRDKKNDSSLIDLHDWTIYSWARSKGYSWYIDPMPSMLYRQHASNVIGVNSGFKAALSRIRKIRSGNYRSQILITATFCESSAAAPIKKLERFNFADRLWLIFHARHMRRRLRDKFAIAISFLIMK